MTTHKGKVVYIKPKRFIDEEAILRLIESAAGSKKFGPSGIFIGKVVARLLFKHDKNILDGAYVGLIVMTAIGEYFDLALKDILRLVGTLFDRIAEGENAGPEEYLV